MSASILAQVSVVLGAELSGFRAGMAQARKELSGLVKFSEGMKDVGESLTKYITLPLLGTGAGVTKVGGDFEAAFNRVEAATQASGAELDALRKKAQGIALDPNLQFSSKQAAQALENLAKNGASTADILGGAADATTALATATGAQLATAADITTDVMNNFGKSAAEAAGLVSNITGTTIASKFSIDDYRLALGQAGAVAGQLGTSFEDFNTALAVTSSGFSSGQDAGTSFKTFMQRLVPQSKEAATAIEKLGLTFFDAQGQLLPMREIAGQLQKSFKGLSDQAKSSFGTQIFGSDAIRTALLLADAGAEGFDKMAESIGKVDAAAQGSIINKGFTGAIEALKSSVEGLAQAIADAGILDFITGLARSAAGLASSLATTSPGVLRFATVLAGLAASIGPVLVVLGSIGASIAPVKAGFAAVQSAATLLKTSFLGLLNPTTLIVVALAAVAAGAYYLATANDRLRESYDEQAKATKKLTSDTSPLIDRYEELKGKTNLTSAEQQELKSIIEQVTAVLPGVAEGMDRYGNTMGIAAGKARELIEAEKERLKSIAKLALPKEEQELKNLEQYYKNLQAVVNNYTKTGRLPSRTNNSAGQLEYYVPDASDLARFSNQLRDANKALSDQQKRVAELRATVEDYEEVVLLAGGNIAAAMEKPKTAFVTLSKEQQDALDKLRKALLDNENASRALGPAYDFVGNKAKILESGVKSLTDVGFAPGGRIVQGYVRDLRSLATAYDQVAIKISKGIRPAKDEENPDAFKTDKIQLPPQLAPIDYTYYSSVLDQKEARDTLALQRQRDFNTGLETLVDQLNVSIGPLLADVANQFGQAFGNIVTGTQSATDAFTSLFGGILQAVASFMGQLGQQLITLGVGKLALENLFKFGGGYGAIAAGVGLVALAGIASSVASKAQSSVSSISGGGGGGGFSPSNASISLKPASLEIKIRNVTTFNGRDVVTSSELENYRRQTFR